MKANDRFILVETYKDDSIKTIIGSFDDICKEIEYQVNKKENDDFKMQNAIVYDRKYSDNDLKLNCYYEVNNRLLYSQFIDSYFGDETL